MSQRQPLIKTIGGGNGGSYGTAPSEDLEDGSGESQSLIVSSKATTKKGSSDGNDAQVTEAIFLLFLMGRHFTSDLSKNPKTNPKLPPEVRYKRHRNYYIFKLNQFRHWWKTSRYVRT